MKLGELAQALGLTLTGDASHRVDRLAPISSAAFNHLSFVVGARYRDALENSKAGAVILPAELSDYAPGNFLVSANPYASYARASWLLTKDLSFTAGIHPTAHIDETAQIDASASIGPHCVIEAGVIVGPNAVIGSSCVLGQHCQIGAGSRLFAHSVVYHRCIVGADCRIQSGAIIGAEGFGYAHDNGWQAIHQTGRVVVGDNVHIGANTTIDRGAIDDTVVSSGVILDNQIQIAHNVQIGENTAIAACVGIAGSTSIGANCQIGGACNIIGHLHIADGVVLTPTSYVTQSIHKSGRYSSGMPLQSSTRWKRTFVLLSRLNELAARVARLEKRGKAE